MMSTAPSQPVGLVGSVVGSTVNLSWTASSDNVGVTRYNVHRGTSAGFTPTVANRVVYARQGMQDVGNIGMVRSGLGFKGRQRLPGERFGLFKLALGTPGDRDIVDPTGLLKGVRSHDLPPRWRGWLGTCRGVVSRRL